MSKSGTTRTPDGKFAGGNPGGPGGAREGAGRKPEEAKKAFRAFLETLDDAARELLTKAFDTETDMDWTERGRWWDRWAEYLHGKPMMRMEVQHDDSRLTNMLASAKARTVAEIGAMGAEYQQRRHDDDRQEQRGERGENSARPAPADAGGKERARGKRDGVRGQRDRA